MSEPKWRKSSYSEASANACVEMAEAGQHITIRDSKHPELPWATVGRGAWTEFTGALRAGRLRGSPQ
ncbi:DUF397 domain-containing protein [Streptomyces sp. N50]|uniref:DUF397 domain-containing protein n=1 Tax=Streptomyces sp. N50 TaxID=3081765 RepID=UPI0029622929|nr:DUF397 domain-containing protein [Streptomyces sp. N50]WOX11827.1 DUF397 domain-containing protein [Streptomyces sp. N50]